MWADNESNVNVIIQFTFFKTPSSTIKLYIFDNNHNIYSIQRFASQNNASHCSQSVFVLLNHRNFLHKEFYLSMWSAANFCFCSSTFALGRFHGSLRSWSLDVWSIRFYIHSELQFSLQRLWLFICIKRVGQVWPPDRKSNWQTSNQVQLLCCFQPLLLDGCCSSWTHTSDCLKQHQILRKSICGNL